MGFFMALGRPVQPGQRLDLLRFRRRSAPDSVGRWHAIALVAAAAGLAIAVARGRCRSRCFGWPGSCAGTAPTSLHAVAAFAAVWAGAAVIGVQAVAGAPRRLDQRRGSGLRPGHPGASRHQGPAGVRQHCRRRCLRGTRRVPSLLTGLRGKDVLFVVRRELRTGRRRRAPTSRRRSTRCSTRRPRVCGRPASPRAARSSPRRPSAASAGSPTRPCSPGCGSTTSSATTSWWRATGSP